MKIETIILIALALTAASGCIRQTATNATTTTTIETSLQPFPVENETFCVKDADCACGVHAKTGECFYGSRRFVDESKQCPDFCTGFSGNLRVKCINQECKQVPITQP